MSNGEEKKDDRKLKLAFSGGGFRATYYCLGAFRRLVELGLWKNVSRIDSVSGGSITAGAILAALKDGDFKDVDDFNKRVTEPLGNLGQLGLREMITRRWLTFLLIIHAIIFSTLTFQLRIPWFLSLPVTFVLFLLIFFLVLTNIFSILFEYYLNKLYFHGLTMDSLNEHANYPEWSANATCLNAGARFRFKQTDFGGHKIGVTTEKNNIRVSFAVACSACFPPVFAPFKLKTKDRKFYFNWWTSNKRLNKNAPEVIYLTDGGVYDNLGSENIIKGNDPFIILDAGGYFPLWKNNQSFSNMFLIWFKLQARILATALNQVTALRRRIIFSKTQPTGGVMLILGEKTKNYIDYPACETFGKLSQNVNNSLPSYEIFDSDVEELVSNIRTDLDCSNEIEIELLMYMGAVKTDIIVKRYLSGWINPSLSGNMPEKPKFSVEEIKEALKNSGRIRMKLFCR